MKRLVLLLPALFLALSLDRLSPDRPKAMRMAVTGLEQAAPMLPAVNEGRFGRPGDPLNVVFVGTPRRLREALASAGWTEVPTSLRGSLAAGLVELLDGRALTAFPPLNDYRLLGRRQSMNWAIAVRPLAERHHFRLWLTGMTDGDGRGVWWGSANYDLSIRWRDFSHRPDPDADRERDFIVKTLTGSPYVQTIALARLPQIPTEGVNDKGYAYRTDGPGPAVIALKR